MSNAKTDYIKLEYQLLDLVEYNGLNITGNMKILLSLIYSYERSHRNYYESLPTLGKRLGLGYTQATRNLISKLCTAGMISYDDRPGTSHIFHSKPLAPELMVFIGDKKQKQPSGKPKAKNKPVEPDAPINDHIQQEEEAECPF